MKMFIKNNFLLKIIDIKNIIIVLSLTISYTIFFYPKIITYVAIINSTYILLYLCLYKHNSYVFLNYLKHLKKYLKHLKKYLKHMINFHIFRVNIIAILFIIFTFYYLSIIFSSQSTIPLDKVSPTDGDKKTENNFLIERPIYGDQKTEDSVIESPTNKKTENNSLESPTNKNKKIGDNLINSDIETSKQGWNEIHYSKSTANITYSSKFQITSNKSLCIEKTNRVSSSAFYKKVSVVPGKFYKLTYYLKTVGISSISSKGAGIWLEYNDNDSISSFSSNEISGDNDWVCKTMTMSFPTDTVTLYFGIKKETGTAYFNNISFSLADN